jgi:hypothetical protein
MQFLSASLADAGDLRGVLVLGAWSKVFIFCRIAGEEAVPWQRDPVTDFPGSLTCDWPRGATGRYVRMDERVVCHRAGLPATHFTRLLRACHRLVLRFSLSV